MNIAFTARVFTIQPGDLNNVISDQQQSVALKE